MCGSWGGGGGGEHIYIYIYIIYRVQGLGFRVVCQFGASSLTLLGFAEIWGLVAHSRTQTWGIGPLLGVRGLTVYCLGFGFMDKLFSFLKQGLNLDSCKGTCPSKQGSAQTCRRPCYIVLAVLCFLRKSRRKQRSPTNRRCLELHTEFMGLLKSQCNCREVRRLQRCLGFTGSVGQKEPRV